MMALPTQFSVTTGKVSPIANPKAPADLPKKLEAEEVNIVSGASLIPSLSTTDTGNPSQLTAENAVTVGAPDSLTAQPVTVTIAPDVLSAQPATITNNPDVLTALPVSVTGNPDVLAAQSKASTPTPVALTPNAGTPTTPPFALNHARILYDNLFQSSAVTASIGSNPEYVRIPNTYQGWTAQPSAEAASITLSNFDSGVVIDTICIGAHNLSDATSTVRFETSTTDTGAFTLREERTITTNDAIMWHTETPIAIKRIRITAVNATGLFKVGYISAGVALQMQRPFFNGHTPITDGDVTEYYSNRSESGEIIGQQIRRKGFETQAQWNNIDDGWYRSYFALFKQFAKTRPFFFAWNLLEYPDDVGFCRINQDIRSPMQNGSTTKRTVNMTLLGAD